MPPFTLWVPIALLHCTAGTLLSTLLLDLSLHRSKLFSIEYPNQAHTMSPKLSLTTTLPLTNSKFKIPQIGFGVYLSPPPTCVQSCVKAFSAGYRHVDTGIYYDNEKSVGRAFKESKIPRAEIFLTSKILSPGNDVESTYKMIEESVKKLDGENGYVDLFLIHTPNGGKESRRIMWLALEKAKEMGKVRDIGVSNYGIGHIEEIKEIGKLWPPVVNQIEVRVALKPCITLRSILY